MFSLQLSAREMAVPAALLGGLLLVLLIIRLGRRRFSLQLFGVSLFGGVLAAIPLLLIAIFTAKLQTPFSPLWQPVFNAFINAGLFEETAKLVAIYSFVRSHYLRRTSVDLVLGAASVALGFALLENVIYVAGNANNWQNIALLRAAMSTHPCFPWPRARPRPCPSRARTDTSAISSRPRAYFAPRSVPARMLRPADHVA